MTHNFDSSVAVIIVGAGQGTRANDGKSKTPKQFTPIVGKTPFQHCLDIFTKIEIVRDIVCVIPVETEADWLLPNDEQGKALLVHGGATRQESVLHGLLELMRRNAAPDIVLVHDAARPFVTQEVILRVVEAAILEGAAIASMPVVDSLKRQDPDGKVSKTTVDRDSLFQAQTPQGFDFKKLLKSHEQAQKLKLENVGDDAELYQHFGYDVALVRGSKDNWKITQANDFAHAERQFMIEGTIMNIPDIRVGHGYDVHAFEAGSFLTLAGLEINHKYSLKGHSDADVGLHALTDAILGALADGDIGSHFPPSDPRWKNAPSDQFLMHAMTLAEDAGAKVNHLDLTFICEAPNIGKHRLAMRKRLSEITGLEEQRISVKATTNEKLGFLGREEGIAAMATATLVFA